VSIPIRNVYYLLLYAWDRLEERDDTCVAGLETTQLVELFGRILHGATTRIFRRGIDRSYQPTTELLTGARGRIELTPTLTRGLLARGQTVCTYDELTVDSPPNQVLKAAAERILMTTGLDVRVADLMRECLGLLRGVGSLPLTFRLCRQAQLHQNNQAYRLPIAIGELLATESLVDDRAETTVFKDFDRSDGPMARLFQDFVKNFLLREQKLFNVRSPAVGWAGLAGSSTARAVIPGMFTDVCLERGGYAAVIETKYYSNPFVGHHGARRIPSAHLYQLYSYVANLAFTRASVDGVLMYAEPGDPLDEEFELQGHRMRVLTLNLAADWQDIHRSLMEVVEWANVRHEPHDAAGKVIGQASTSE
jgi:5-methylcytosine-specific restriction enzyme subunit McrC